MGDELGREWIKQVEVALGQDWINPSSKNGRFGFLKLLSFIWLMLQMILYEKKKIAFREENDVKLINGVNVLCCKVPVNWLLITSHT